jgi:transcriptional regulator with XRE-family HTH domain
VLTCRIVPVPAKHTTTEWEAILGQQVKSARVAADLDQQRLASLANVSVRSISNLERGKGSSVRTLVAVVRALGRSEWLEALAPPVTVSPIRMLRAQHGPQQRVRMRQPGGGGRTP